MKKKKREKKKKCTKVTLLGKGGNINGKKKPRLEGLGWKYINDDKKEAPSLFYSIEKFRCLRVSFRYKI